MKYPKGAVPRDFAPRARGRAPQMDGNRAGNAAHKAWLQRIRDLATGRGWTVACWWRSDHSPPGFPDTMMVHAAQGRLIFIEAKTGDARLSRHQEKWRDLVLGLELEWYVMRPDDEALLVRILDGG
jgi:hypothetical protein